jgi:hypothetical protein
MVESQQHEFEPIGSIANFALFKELGSGNYGIGYLAQAEGSAELVCVKVFKNSTDSTFDAEVSAG